MYRSQLLLQQLGIQQWIPQQQITQKVSADVLWADQQVDAQAIVVSMPVAAPTIVARNIDQHALSPLKQISPAVEPLNQEKAVAHVESSPVSDLVTEPEYPQEIHFNYQVIVQDQLVIVAHVSNEKEQILLNNISHACHASSFYLQWPLPIETWDMNDFVLQSYVQGVFAAHQQKLFISLGEIQLESLQGFQQQFKRHASLQDLLKSPEQKKRLWQVLSPLIYDTE